MDKKENSKAKVVAFMKKNVYYILMGVCVIIIATMITVAALVNNNQGVDGPVIDKPDVEDPDINKPDTNPDDNKPSAIIFEMPVSGASEGLKFSIDELVDFTETLKQWSVHKGLDLIAPEGSEVFAAYAGTVESVEYDEYNGSAITIDHGDGLKTVYRSLGKDAKVKVGDKVSKGQVIGTVSDLYAAEKNQGAHLHFEVIKNNQWVDPVSYLPSGDK